VYLVYGNRRAIKRTKELLHIKEERYDETKFPEYLLVWNDPKNILPPEMLPRVDIKKCEHADYYSIIKDAGAISYLFIERRPEIGNVVQIKSGMFEGLRGIVKEVKQLTCKVEFDVWGQIANHTFNINEVKVQETTQD